MNIFKIRASNRKSVQASNVYPSKIRKMMSKVVIFVVLVSMSIAHGARITVKQNTDIVPVEKEGRLIDIPIIGTVLLKSLKIACFLISAAWSVIGFKLAALAFVSKALFWVLHKFFSVILGSAIMLAFCKFTGKCSLDYVPLRLVNVGDTLVYAARNLDEGIMKYGQNSD